MLTALAGRIGTEDDFVETDLDDRISTTGTLTADATLGIYLWEVTGDLRLALVTADQASLAGVTDAALVAGNGSIVDAQADAAADVVAHRIDLRAINGSIGSADNDLEIDSATFTTHRAAAACTPTPPSTSRSPRPRSS